MSTLNKTYYVTAILRRKKDGDWYIYPWNGNLSNVHKNVQKSYKIFKPKLHNVLSTGTNIVKFGFLRALEAVLGSQGSVVMYSNHLFSYGGCLYWIKLITSPQSSVGKKMATGIFTHSSWRKKTLTTFTKMYRKVIKSSNLGYTMSLVQGQIL